MANRISLEPIHPRHADAVQELASHPEIVSMTKLPTPYPEDGAIRWIEDAVARRRANLGYAFAIMHEGTLVGVTGLHCVYNGQAELGYWIGRPYWNQGFATEANVDILQFAFAKRKLRRVIALPLEYNGASCRVLEKLGFRNGGIVTHPHPSLNDDDPLVRYVMTQEHWYSVYVSPPDASRTNGTQKGSAERVKASPSDQETVR